MKSRIENIAQFVPISDERYLVSIVQDSLKAANFTIIQFAEKKFEPYGYTALWLLGESHAAVHSFPENGNSYLEVSSCLNSKLDLFIDSFNTIQDKCKIETKRIIE